jgi:hypothetical protein
VYCWPCLSTAQPKTAKPGTMEKRRKKVGKLLLSMLAQLIPVAVGVYLSIKASNWNTEKSKKPYRKSFYLMYIWSF